MADHIARILVVDDEATLSNALCHTLSACGYETVGFTDGGAALDALRGSHFDLLLADLVMPGMDGIALLGEALRVDRTLAGIIMTGEGTIASAVEAMKAGALDYILKPFKLGAILPVLSRAVAVRNMRIENESLARGLRERTAELETANKELEAFSYSVSHDLRAPLRGIDGFSRVLQEDCGHLLDDKGRDCLMRIGAAAQRMGELIDDMLALSQIGRAELRRAPADLSGTARAIADELSGQDPARRVAFDIAPGVIAQADSRLLRVLLENLLGNAWKFTSRVAWARIEVGVAEMDGAQAYFVRDNGAGFDQAYAGKLFVPFQRLHGATEFPGTGIGLSIAHRIVQRHGGRVWGESEPGKGATFYFTLCGAAQG
jgi:signal transduction histidine kinase